MSQKVGGGGGGSVGGKGFQKNKGAPADPTRVPANIESTYFGQSIPDEVRECVPLLHKAPTEIVRESLQLVVSYLKGYEIAQNDYATLLKKANFVDGLNFTILISGLYSILRIAVKQKVKLSTVAGDLKRMNVPDPSAEDLIRVLRVARGELEMLAINNRVRFPKLDKLRWRVDVVISSGSLNRVMKPTLMFQVILSGGVVKTFEVSIEQFNQLRLGVATVLHDMQMLDRHPIIRIINEFDKREKEERMK